MNRQCYLKKKDHSQGEQIWGSCGGKGGSGIDGHLGGGWLQNVIFGMDEQWGPTVQHREMYVIGSLYYTTELEKHCKSTIL